MAPKIGVYICHCGLNIAGTVDIDQVTRCAESLPNVKVARHYQYLCSDPGQELIRKDIAELGVDRVVVASCSPRMHEVTFRRTVGEAGLNPYLFTMANIREQCSWVHEDQSRATDKAVSLIAGMVSRASLLWPLEEREVQVNPSALVIGGGIAGMQAALDIADAGFKAWLVEKEPTIGGRMAQLDKTFPTLDCSACILTPKMVDVHRNENIELLTYSEVTEVEGYIGNFKAKVKRKPRYINEEKCTGCGLCVTNCPVRYEPQIPAPVSVRDSLEEAQVRSLDGIVDRCGATSSALIGILQEINAEYSYLPDWGLRLVAEALNLDFSTVYQVATFFRAFSLKPRGKHLIQVCLGTACHVGGGEFILGSIERELGIGPGETTGDLLFTLETVRCIGCCALAPVIRIDDATYGHLTQDKMGRILESYQNGTNQGIERSTCS